MSAADDKRAEPDSRGSRGSGGWQRWALRVMTAVLLLLALLPWSRGDDAVAETGAATSVDTETPRPAATAGPSNDTDENDNSTESTTDDQTEAPDESVESEDSEDSGQSEPPESAASAIDLAAFELAVAEALELFDFEGQLPEWTIEPAPPDTSAASYTYPLTRSIFVNSDGTIPADELTIAVLHAIGHAVDVTVMTEEMRDAFRLFRNHNPATDWVETDNNSTATEPMNSAEDFAEVFVAWVKEGDYTTRSTSVADQPSDADLVLFCVVLALDGVDCDITTD